MISNKACQFSSEAKMKESLKEEPKWVLYAGGAAIGFVYAVLAFFMI